MVDANRPLFVHELWFDSSHMNRKGAEFFSRYLAEQVEGAKGRLPAPSPSKVPPVVPPQLTARWADDGVRAVEFDAKHLPVAGEVTVVVSLQQADEDLGGGLRRLVALPFVAAVQLTRAGAGSGHVRLDLGGLATDGPLYSQLCVTENGAVTQASACVELEGKRGRPR